MTQNPLFHGEHLPPRVAYQRLFSFLPTWDIIPSRGRPATDPNALLRACIYRCLRGLPTLSDLTHILTENPSLLEAIGFDPFRRPPSIERFSAWLRLTACDELDQIRIQLLRSLAQRGGFSASTLALDSAPVPAPVRENNLKTSMADRFNKHRFPQHDPQARLGAYRCYPGSGTQKIRYFWGYRNHIVIDFDSELPLAQTTRPANQHESRFAIPLLQDVHRLLEPAVQCVCADSAYDSEKILAYIIETLGAAPVIAPNSRYQPSPEFRLQGKVVLCPASLPMVHKGRMAPKRTGITYRQYCCPIHYRKSFQQKYLLCPANHPKFFSQKGCNYLRRQTPSYRNQIPYGSPEFAQLYKNRTSVERVFSRLLSLVMQKPTVLGLHSVANHCTIAHITVPLVATAALELGHPDKLAFVRSFVPRFMAEKPLL